MRHEFLRNEPHGDVLLPDDGEYVALSTRAATEGANQ